MRVESSAAVRTEPVAAAKPIARPERQHDESPAQAMRGKAKGLLRKLEADTFRGASAEMHRARLADRLTGPPDEAAPVDEAPETMPPVAEQASDGSGELLGGPVVDAAPDADVAPGTYLDVVI